MDAFLQANLGTILTLFFAANVGLCVWLIATAKWRTRTDARIDSLEKDRDTFATCLPGIRKELSGINTKLAVLETKLANIENKV